MVFSSLVFLCIFLPVIFVLYRLIKPLWGKNILLIIGSLVFYAYGEPVYVLLMVASAVINYVCARGIQTGKHRKGWLAAAVILDIGILCVFKYTGMIVETINRIPEVQIPIPQIILPIGISFFTFQGLSYVIDVYRRQVEAQKNFAKILLYISLFPQLIAGPIVKYHDIFRQIDEREIVPRETALGMRRFLAGLGKKVIIANTMGAVADSIFSADAGAIFAPLAWLAAIAYMLQIYFDFSAYSDMAIGLGRMFGFRLKENFMFPYAASSVKDFWRRWHISLSTWFKEYLYIPLGGNRKGKGRAAVNRIIVFFLCGLWHGANWTFVIWGLWHGLFLLLEEYVQKMRKLPIVLANVYTLLVVCVGFVMFRADNIGQGAFMIRQMFSGFSSNPEGLSLLYQQFTPWMIFILIVAVFLAAPVSPFVAKLRRNNEKDPESTSKKWHIVQGGLTVMSVALLVFCMLRLSGAAYNPFIYFKF